MLKVNLRALTVVSMMGVALSGQAIAASPLTWNTAPDQITEMRANELIIGDGYTQVTRLTRAQGGWTADALESGKPVSLLVTNLGSVGKV